jgi:hypothetical protein
MQSRVNWIHVDVEENCIAWLNNKCSLFTVFTALARKKFGSRQIPMAI